MAPTLWIDVEDLFEYAAYNHRLSGIQRVQLLLCQALQDIYGDQGRVRYLRHAAGGAKFRVIPHEDIVALASRLTGSDAKTPSKSLAVDGQDAAPRRNPARELLRRLPLGLKSHLGAILRHQVQAIAATARLGVYVAASAKRQLTTRKAGSSGSAQDSLPFASVAKPQDWIVTLGSPWSNRTYDSLIKAAKDETGCRFALLIYDIIPLVAPEYCDIGLVQMFRAWHATVPRLADVVMTESHSSARDLERHREDLGLVSGPVQVIPMGTDIQSRHQAATPRAARLPQPGSYVLFVSTLEPRKNHRLLFRVWRRLAADLPTEQVPTLVFAGRVGWMVGDLMQQLANSDWVGGKIVLLENVTDDELLHLYDGCQFTLYPSFYEGWGLPVTESFAMGRPCLSSNSTSLPEAGGSLARYFDPDSASDAYQAVRALIEAPDQLEAWRRQVQQDFVPVPWSAAATAIVSHLEAVPADAASKAPSQ